jgi:cytochrome c556
MEFRMKLVLALAAALAASPALGNPVEERQALMKERSNILRVLVPMIQGKIDFEAEAAADALGKLVENGEQTDVDALWPEGSQANSKSTQAVWDDWDAFVKANADYARDAQAALDATPRDLAALRTAFGPVAAHCGSCHETFRN